MPKIDLFIDYQIHTSALLLLYRLWVSFKVVIRSAKDNFSLFLLKRRPSFDCLCFFGRSCSLFCCGEERFTSEGSLTIILWERECSMVFEIFELNSVSETSFGGEWFKSGIKSDFLFVPCDVFCRAIIVTITKIARSFLRMDNCMIWMHQSWWICISDDRSEVMIAYW